MAILKLDSKDGVSLVLGIQTNATAREVANDVEFKIKAWTPKRAKSFSILEFSHLDAQGREVAEVTGLARVQVIFCTRKGEGAFKVGDPVTQLDLSVVNKTMLAFRASCKPCGADTVDA